MIRCCRNFYPREKRENFYVLNDGQKIDALNEIIKESEHIVFFGGAEGKALSPGGEPCLQRPECA